MQKIYLLGRQSWESLTAWRTQKSLRQQLGILIIFASHLFCWPLISLLGLVAALMHLPSLVAVGGPVVYVGTYALMAAGVHLAGREVFVDVLRVFDIRGWLT